LLGNGVDALNDIGALLWLGVIVFAFVMDGTGVLTLRGRVLSSVSRAVLIVLAVVLFGFLVIWIIPYLIIAVVDAYRGRSPMTQLDEVDEQAKRIAKLEGSLGILPTAEGVCANCHKPLQLGAEYCAYCGTPVAPALQVCPVCHARTFPDAKWCPECGAALAPDNAAQQPPQVSS
jgi:RNA polymerase subunit RPABC4/transcription elongation factor Spt4